MNDKTTSAMDKFNFLLGSWKLEYKVPESEFSPGDYGEGKGEFKRILNDKYVTFDYVAKLSQGEGAAHAIFAWDEKSKFYRYWWFEDSGEFMKATCNFLDEDTLALNWHNSLLVQTFSKVNDNEIVLKMKYPLNKDEYKLILEVVFIRTK